MSTSEAKQKPSMGPPIAGTLIPKATRFTQDEKQVWSHIQACKKDPVAWGKRIQSLAESATASIVDITGYAFFLKLNTEYKKSLRMVDVAINKANEDNKGVADKARAVATVYLVMGFWHMHSYSTNVYKKIAFMYFHLAFQMYPASIEPFSKRISDMVERIAVSAHALEDIGNFYEKMTNGSKTEANLSRGELAAKYFYLALKQNPKDSKYRQKVMSMLVLIRTAKVRYYHALCYLEEGATQLALEESNLALELLHHEKHQTAADRKNSQATLLVLQGRLYVPGQLVHKEKAAKYFFDASYLDANNQQAVTRLYDLGHGSVVSIQILEYCIQCVTKWKDLEQVILFRQRAEILEQVSRYNKAAVESKMPQLKTFYAQYARAAATNFSMEVISPAASKNLTKWVCHYYVSPANTNYSGPIPFGRQLITRIAEILQYKPSWRYFPRGQKFFFPKREESYVFQSSIYRINGTAWIEGEIKGRGHYGSVRAIYPIIKLNDGQITVDMAAPRALKSINLIKYCKDTETTTAIDYREFQTEMNTLRSIDPRSIAMFIKQQSATHNSHYLFFTQPYYRKINIEKWLSANKKQPLQMRIKIIRNLIYALEQFHRQTRRIHGDLSVHNVLCNDQGAVDLVDFFLSTKVGEDIRTMKYCNYLGNETTQENKAAYSFDLFPLAFIIHKLVYQSEIALDRAHQERKLNGKHPISPVKYFTPPSEAQEVYPGLGKLLTSMCHEDLNQRPPLAEVKLALIYLWRTQLHRVRAGASLPLCGEKSEAKGWKKGADDNTGPAPS